MYKLPKGAILLHLYHPENVLRPRGGKLQKESLSLKILENLRAAFESWTDPKYGDSLTKEELFSLLSRNLSQEVYFAWDKFLDEIKHQQNQEEGGKA
jgi:hypothetical protein